MVFRIVARQRQDRASRRCRTTASNSRRSSSLIDGEIAEIAKNGVTEAELDRAKKAYLAEYVYQTDNQASLARRYGWALTVGSTIKDIEEWPERLAKVTADEVKAAVRHLDIRRSVTGTLLPVAPDGVPGIAPKPGRGQARAPDRNGTVQVTSKSTRERTPRTH